CGTYGKNPQLLPTSKTERANAPQKFERIPGGAEGHYAQWLEGALAGYGKKEMSSPFELVCPLNQCLAMANLAIRAFDIREPRADGKGYNYPARYRKLLWDDKQMRITNLDAVNQFVKREYREGWELKL